MRSVRLSAVRGGRRQQERVIERVAEVDDRADATPEMAGDDYVSVDNPSIREVSGECQRHIDDAVVAAEIGRPVEVDYRGIQRVLGRDGAGDGLRLGRYGISGHVALLSGDKDEPSA